MKLSWKVQGSIEDSQSHRHNIGLVDNATSNDPIRFVRRELWQLHTPQRNRCKDCQLMALDRCALHYSSFLAAVVQLVRHNLCRMLP